MTNSPKMPLPLDLSTAARSQCRVFLDDIADNPNDAGLRLIFADWLEEQKDPRAELLRAQGEYLRNGSQTALESRVQRWLLEGGRDWLGDLSIEFGCARPGFGLLAVGGQSAETFLNDPKIEGLRQALREGWFRTFRMNRFSPGDIARAAELGLLSGCGELDWLSGMFTDGCLAWLSQGTQLRGLGLQGLDATVTDQGLSPLAGLARLRWLYVSGLTDITGSGLTCLSDLRHLRTLTLSGCRQLKDIGLARLATCGELEKLTLNRCGAFSDAGLLHLSTLQSLRYLNLSGNYQLTGAGLEHLVRLPNLKHLILSHCHGLSDASLGHLAKLAGLENLELYDCPQLTGAGFNRLHPLTNLKRLDPRACKLKPHETRALRKILPGCEVMRS